MKIVGLKNLIVQHEMPGAINRLEKELLDNVLNEIGSILCEFISAREEVLSSGNEQEIAEFNVYASRLDRIVARIIALRPLSALKFDRWKDQNGNSILQLIFDADFISSAIEAIVHDKEFMNKQITCNGEEMNIVKAFIAEKKNYKMARFMLDSMVFRYSKDVNGRTSSMYCVQAGFEDLVLQALDDEKLATMQDRKGYNLGMLSAKYGLSAATNKALDSYHASTQCNILNENIGIIAAKNGDISESIINKALDNVAACTMQDCKGYNMGMYICEQYNKGQRVLSLSMKYDMGRSSILCQKALHNKHAREQKNMHGKTMVDIAKERGLAISSYNYFI